MVCVSQGSLFFYSRRLVGLSSPYEHDQVTNEELLSVLHLENRYCTVCSLRRQTTNTHVVSIGGKCSQESVPRRSHMAYCGSRYREIRFVVVLRKKNLRHTHTHTSPNVPAASAQPQASRHSSGSRLPVSMSQYSVASLSAAQGQSSP